jgi:DNA-binding transcriptional LysR family regulator
METNRLRAFRAVVETGSLRQAAELLRISHSGLSKALKALEVELGLTLLMPSGRGIVVTDDGQRVYARSTEVLAAVDALINATPEPEREVIRIGSFEVFTAYFVAAMVREHFGTAAVEVHDLVPGRLEEALLTNKVDIGITYDPLPRTGVDYTKVTSIRMAPYVRHDAFVESAIEDIPFVVPVQPLEGTPSGVRGSDAWPETRFPRRIVYRVDLLTTGLALVTEGLCAIFMPEPIAHHHDATTTARLRLRELPHPKGMRPITRDVFIVKRESTPESPTMRKIARTLRHLNTQR